MFRQAVAKTALESGGSVYALVLENGLVTKAELDELLVPEKVTAPRPVQASDSRES